MEGKKCNRCGTKKNLYSSKNWGKLIVYNLCKSCKSLIAQNQAKINLHNKQVNSKISVSLKRFYLNPKNRKIRSLITINQMKNLKQNSKKYLAWKQKLSKTHLGKKLSEEHKNKISESNKGIKRPCSEKQKQILRTRNIGMKHNLETKKLLSEKAKYCWKNSVVLKSKEYRKKRSELTKKQWVKQKENKEFMAKLIKNLREKHSIQAKKYKFTKIELKIKSFLEFLKIDFVCHHPINDIEHIFNCDFYIKSSNTIVECDGNYWHNYPTYREIDLKRNIELKNKGYNLIRLWESEINWMDVNDFKLKLGAKE